MEQIPEFWRTEVFHPLSVHFPIALLLVGFIFKVVALAIKKEVWITGGSILLILGTIGAWIAIYTGDLADGIVSRKLCDPTVLKEHENMAYLMAWIFTGAVFLDLLRFTKTAFFKGNLVSIFMVVVLAVGSVLLGYVGHLGATLVYQQGAGVYHPSGDCVEFN